MILNNNKSIKLLSLCIISISLFTIAVHCYQFQESCTRSHTLCPNSRKCISVSQFGKKGYVCVKDCDACKNLLGDKFVTHVGAIHETKKIKMEDKTPVLMQDTDNGTTTTIKPAGEVPAGQDVQNNPAGIDKQQENQEEQTTVTTI